MLFRSFPCLAQEEIDTHLHVLTIDLNDNYANAFSSRNALDIMQAKYGGNSWHTTGTDLHHALLGNPLGGGVAYIGQVCDSQWGFGLTASLTGSYTGMDSAVVWDVMAVRGFLLRARAARRAWFSADADLV